MNRITFIICILLPVLSFSQAHKWHGTNQDQKYPDINLMEVWPDSGLQVVQTYQGLGEGYGTPSLNEDGIFVAGMIDTIGSIFHFNHEGKLMWQTPYGLEYTYKFPGSRGTPTLLKGRLYYTGSNGDVLCLNMKTGEKIWAQNIFEKYKGQKIKWGYTESALIYNDLLIVQPGGPEVSICALNKADGSMVWEMELDSSANAYCSPKIINHKGHDLCMINMSKHLVLFNPLNGEIKYKHPLNNSRVNHTNENIYFDEKIFYTSGYGEGSVLFKLNDETQGLDTLWQNTSFDSKMSGTIQIDSLVYGTLDKGKQWAAINISNGELAFKSRDLKPGSFVYADGKFFIFTETGEIALAKPIENGMEIISRFPCPIYPTRLAFAHPVIYKGHLYIRLNDRIWKYNISQ